ncbi:histidine phosphatase family protein [bacterium]|nr:histidine phosphatase family protein [bacterium]
MFIYIVRHGDALGGYNDDKRPLSKAGKLEIQNVADAAVAQGNCHPQRILHSPKLRAVETAEILQSVFKPVYGMNAVSGLLPDDDSMELRHELGELDSSVMLVSHMPFVYGLMASLLPLGSPYAGPFSTGEMQCVELLNGGIWEWRWCLRP